MNFKCEYCKYTTKRTYNLIRHQFNVHKIKKEENEEKHIQK